jgi:hypothetical protein
MPQLPKDESLSAQGPVTMYKCASLHQCINVWRTNIKIFQKFECWRSPAVFSLLHALARLMSERCSCIIELHKIETRPRLFPYNDMVDWALDHVDIPTRTIFNSQKVTIRSFRPEHLQVIYKLSLVSNFVYNANFLVDFNKKECDQYGKNLPDLIKDWYSHPEKFRSDCHGIYSVPALEPHIMYI